MNELLGLAYYAEIPAVVVDVQRVGPSTGMPTRTQQGDLLECAYASHGDTKHILLFPANPAECFEFAVKSFDLAERFQTPVFMLSDLDIGMNDWVVPRLTWDDSYRPDRGRVLNEEDLRKLATTYYRYADEDENFVTPRTLPGVAAKGAYVTRGSGHNKFGAYTETPNEYQEVMDRLAKKHAAAADFVPEPKIQTVAAARFGISDSGRLRSGGARSDRLVGRARYRGRLYARLWISVRQNRGSVLKPARIQFCGGTESRCTAFIAVDAGNGYRERKDQTRLDIRRISAERAPRGRRDSRVNWRNKLCHR